MGQAMTSLLLLCLLWRSIHAILLPSLDDFYTPPAGFEHEKPGAVLKYRALPSHSFSVLSAFPQNLKGLYQILYRTTDGLGDPVTTITTVLVPYGADPTKLVSYQVAQDSSSMNCAPSYTLQFGSTSFDFLTQMEPLLIDSLLARGWYVSIPDYEGPKALFGVGLMAGKATLDGIRAVLSSSNYTKIDPRAEVQMWGYSGGTIPVGWAAQLHPSYAPELNIIGAALGGTLVSPNATINVLTQPGSQSLVFLYYRGLANQYKDMADYMDSIIKPEKKTAYAVVQSVCVTELMVKYAFENLASYVTRPDYADHPIVHRVLEDNVMGRMDVPNIPLLLYHAQNDKMAPLSQVEGLYRKWCNGGANIQLVRDRTTAHSIHLLTGAPDAVGYLEDRFHKKPLPAGCSTRRTLSSLHSNNSFKTLRSIIWNAFIGLRGAPLGSRTKVTAR